MMIWIEKKIKHPNYIKDTTYPRLHCSWRLWHGTVHYIFCPNVLIFKNFKNFKILLDTYDKIIYIWAILWKFKCQCLIYTCVILEKFDTTMNVFTKFSLLEYSIYVQKCMNKKKFIHLKVRPLLHFWHKKLRFLGKRIYFGCV